MKLQVIIAFLFAFCTLNVSLAQTATVKGNVAETVNGVKQPIPFANVSLEGTTTGGTTDFDGNFEFKAKPGTYKLMVSFTGYNTVRVDVVLEDGQVLVKNLEMGKNIQQLKAAVVTAKMNRESESALALDQKKSSNIQQSIGSAALSQKGASDVSAGVTKMSGVSKASSRGIFVRGLGDRYNNVYLNGMPLPSPNPNKKIIELSLIPTSVVRNIDVFKTFNVNQFGDMSGASLDINTKDTPENDFISFSVGTNFNTRSTFRDFKNQRDGDFDYFGFSGKGREEPAIVNNNGVYGVESETGKDPFNSGLDHKKFSAPMDQRYRIQGGKVIERGEHKLGFVASASYRNSHRYDEGKNYILDAQQVESNNSYRKRYRFATNLTTLVGAEYSKSEKHFINLNYLFINNSNNNYITSHGINDELNNPDINDIFKIRSRYVEKQLHNAQLKGRHLLTESIEVNWGGSFAKAKTDEPDRKDLSFITLKGREDAGIFSSATGGVNQRYFQYTNENEYYGFAEGAYKFGTPLDAEKDDYRHKLVVGGQLRMKDRDVEFRTHVYQPGKTIDGPTLDLTNLDNVFSDQAYANKDYTYSLIYSGASISTARRNIMAGYAYADLNISEKLKVIPGVRLEYTDQLVKYRQEGTRLEDPYLRAAVDTIDILPSIAAKYKLSDLNALRFAASKTVTRPNFMELIPIGFKNENGQDDTGNPNLKNSEVYNFDLKAERINNRGELASVGVFYKYIDKPIERIASGVNFISYFNMNRANVYGIELDYNVRLGSIVGKTENPIIKGIYFDGNITVMQTDVVTTDLDPETQARLTKVTKSSRQLQGASPYLINFAVGFDKPFFKKSKRSNVSISYNRFGKRIFTAGTLDRGDEYGLAYGTLNLVVQNTWKNGFGVRFVAGNLLDPEIRREQEAGPNATLGNVVTQSYRAGMNFGISLTYTLTKKEE